MGNKFKVKNGLNISPVAGDPAATGDLTVNSSESNKIKYHNGSIVDYVVMGTQMEDSEADIAILVGQVATNTADIVTAQATADNHIADTTAAHAASAIAVTPAGNLAADDVQEALTELQTDVDGREPAITTLSIAKGGTNSTTALNNNRVMQSSGSAIVEAAAITASRALVSDANGIPTHATTTAAEIGHVNGVTSAIQTQLDAKVAKSTYSAKGSLLAATAASTPADVAVGANGLFLKADSTASTGVAWASPAGANLSVVTKTGAYTATTSDDVILCSGAAFTVTLFAASGNSGKQLLIKKTDATLANIITIDGDGTETIDGATTITLGKEGEAVRIVCDGTNWQVVEWFKRAGLVGCAQIPTTTNLTGWTRSNTVLGAFASDADAPDWTIISNLGPGTIQAANSDLPKVTVNDLPDGTYKVTFNVSPAELSGSVAYYLAINDGTTTSPVGFNLGGGSTMISLVGVFTYTSIGNRTFELYGASSSGGAVGIACDNYNENVTVLIERV